METKLNKEAGARYKSGYSISYLIQLLITNSSECSFKCLTSLFHFADESRLSYAPRLPLKMKQQHTACTVTGREKFLNETKINYSTAISHEVNYYSLAPCEFFSGMCIHLNDFICVTFPL